MKTYVFALCALVGGAGIAAAIVSRTNRKSEAPAPDPRLETVAKLESEVADLRRRLDALEASRAGGDSVPAHATASGSSKKGAGESDPAAARKEGASDGNADFAAAVADVVAAGFTQEAIDAFIEKVRKAKGHEAAIEAAKAFADREPQNAKAHYLLARAYVDKLMVSQSYADMTKYGELCMAEYGRALEIDPGYWEPRFERAISYTFYPEQMGVMPDAIRDFETLRTQQNRSNSDPRFADTYANLARAYVRTGKKDKAEATLREGTEVFPENEALKKQLQELQE